jgi:phosphoglycolate phosphatase-like HAD superfamily hydrolase
MDRTCDLLDRLGIAGHFVAIYTSDTVPAPKPAPDMALRFAAAVGAPPGEILMIGDAEADIRCGQAAGCATAAATWGYCGHEALVALSPDHVFATPAEACAAIAAMTAP